jgi:hypothetical protein
MALSPAELARLKRLARARLRVDAHDVLAAAVGELAEEVEADSEVIRIAAKIREDGYTVALAEELAAALRKLRASAFVWEEGDVTFHDG